MSEQAVEYGAMTPMKHKKRLEAQLLDLLQAWERENPGFEIVGADLHRAPGMDVMPLHRISVEIRVR
jgi:hypothetical protein